MFSPKFPITKQRNLKTNGMPSSVYSPLQPLININKLLKFTPCHGFFAVDNYTDH